MLVRRKPPQPWYVVFAIVEPSLGSLIPIFSGGLTLSGARGLLRPLILPTTKLKHNVEEDPGETTETKF